MSGFAERMLTKPQLISTWPRAAAAPRRRHPAMQQAARLFQLWRRRVRERRALAQLTDRDLRDLLLTRVDVQNELAKPFWRG